MKKEVRKLFNKEEELESKIHEIEDILESSAELVEKIDAVKSLIDEMRKEIMVNYYEALTDDLTGLLKKKVVRAVFHRKASEAKRHEQYLSLVLLDIDGMKKYNDSFGHLAGTKLIKNFAKAIEKSIRGQDLASRYGGDEFMLLCLHKEKKSIELIIDRIREQISKIVVEDDFTPSASIGYSSCPPSLAEKSHLDEMFEEADKLLYQEKSEKKKIDNKHKLR